MGWYLVRYTAIVQIICYSTKKGTVFMKKLYSFLNVETYIELSQEPSTTKLVSGILMHELMGRDPMGTLL